ncbi:hypothetical protein KR054_003644, partial [Drosophila jambulina]
NANVRLDLVFKVDPHVRIRTPIRQLSETVRSYFQDITLADVLFPRNNLGSAGCGCVSEGDAARLPED